jgi:ribonuclease R
MSKRHNRKKSRNKGKVRAAPEKSQHAPSRSKRSGQQASSFKEIIGTVQAHEKGFGFFVPEDGSPDAFVNPGQMRGVLNGDRVRARVRPDPRREKQFVAEVVGIVERAHSTMVGTLFKNHGDFFLKSDDTRMRLPVLIKPAPPKAQPGQKVVVRITKWPSGAGSLEGHLTEILGYPDDPGVDVKSVIHKYQWPESFPPELERLSRQMPENPAPKDWQGRLDLRDQMIFTIDGPDAKDFDDAISLEKDVQGNYRLGVHIADVSHYVREGSGLDREALQRGTSLYLADRVFPMLPFFLSDGLCSLREGVPRLTITVFLEFASDGKPRGAKFHTSVIQSRRRCIYEEVQQVLDGEVSPTIRAKYAPLEKTLRDMIDLSRLIRARRESLFALDFDFPEIRAMLGETGQVVDIRKKARLESHRLIEDFMIAANEAAAFYLHRSGVPGIYRVHEAPNPADLDDLKLFLAAYHVPFKHLDLGAQQGIHGLLKSVKGSSLELPVSTLVLRSMKLAIYSPANLGHFALALKSYCHFTSPIRRYPDLAVHRSLKDLLDGHAARQNHSYDKIAKHCSEKERLAEKAERENQKLLQLRFMQDKVGRTFDGVARHLTAYGAYVELLPSGVEGFLPLESLTDDAYVYDAASLVLRGKRGAKIELGSGLKVGVVSADLYSQRLQLKRVYD